MDKLSVIERARWWFSGEVAEAAENMHDRLDVVIFPILLGVTTVLMAFGAYALFIFEPTAYALSLLSQVGGVLVGLSAVFGGIHTLILVTAAVVYATEPTELPAHVDMEGSDS